MKKKNDAAKRSKQNGLVEKSPGVRNSDAFYLPTVGFNE